MTAPVCSDDEFIKLWQEHKSPQKLARVLKIGARSVYERRRSIEQRYGVNLNSAQHTDKIIEKRHEARVYQEFSSGTAIVFSDAHFFPNEDTVAYKALLKFVEELRPKVVVCNGDAFDGATISRYAPINWDTMPTVKEELDAVEEHLTRIEDKAKSARLVWCLGNHDARFEGRLAQNVPEYRGVIRFSLKDHFPKWLPCWSFWLNDTICKHRFKGGLHSAFNNTIHSGMNICTGHDHQLWDRVFRDYRGIRYGIDTGMLADPLGRQFVGYTEDNPTGWNSGFYVLTYHNGRLLSPERVIVVEDHVEFRGQIISV